MLKKFILIVSIFTLASCVNYADMHAESKLMQPNDLHSDTTQIARVNWPQDNWWLKFNDPQLNSLIKQALADSPNIKVAEARLRAKQQAANQTEAGLYPTLNATGSVVPQRISQTSIYPPGFIPSNLTVTDLALNFQYDFDWWGKNRETLAATLSEAQATAADLASAQLVLTTSITQTYFQTLNNKLRVALAQENSQLQNKLLQLVKLRQQQGVASELEVQQAIANAEAAKINLEKFKQNYAVSQHQLAALLGKNPEAFIAITGNPANYSFSLPKILPANLIARRPDVTALRWRVESAGHNIKVAKAKFFPDINLAATLGYETITFSKLLRPQSLMWSAGPAFNLPIFEAGALRANLGTQYANYDTAVEQYNQQVVTAMQEAADQVSILKSILQQQLAQRGNLAAAQKSYALTDLRYRNGLDDALATLQAKTALVAQRDSQIQLQLQHTLAVVNLIKSIGGGY